MQNKWPRARYENLKHKVTIGEVLERVIGRPTGFDSMIRCPLHNDRTPSMKIYLDRNGCKCFGACGRWFDPISLWADFQGIKSHQALEELEEMFSVKWNGFTEEFEETEDQLSPWPRLEAELLRLCRVCPVSEVQRIKIRESYWLAEVDHHNIKQLSKLVGMPRAMGIIERWRDDHER